MCVCVFECVCVCVWDCYRWPPSRWENAGSLLVCVHMYQTQHVFPFQRRGILCVCVCVWVLVLTCVYVCECVYVADHTGRLTSRNPCSKNRHCVFPALTHRYHRTHTLTQDTHTHTDHCPILFSLAGFLSAYPCASGRQDVSLWLSWENLLSGNKPEDTNRRGVTASLQSCWFFRTPFGCSFWVGTAPLLLFRRHFFLRHALTTNVPSSFVSLSIMSHFLFLPFYHSKLPPSFPIPHLSPHLYSHILCSPLPLSDIDKRSQTGKWK